MEFSLPFGETKVRSQKWQLLGRREQEEWRAVGVAYRLGEADTDPMPSGPPPLGWQGDLGGFAPRHAPRDGRPSQAAPRRGGAGHSKEMEGNLGNGHQYPGKVGGDSCSHGQGGFLPAGGQGHEGLVPEPEYAQTLALPLQQTHGAAKAGLPHPAGAGVGRY